MGLTDTQRCLDSVYRKGSITYLRCIRSGVFKYNSQWISNIFCWNPNMRRARRGVDTLIISLCMWVGNIQATITWSQPVSIGHMIGPHIWSPCLSKCQNYLQFLLQSTLCCRPTSCTTHGPTNNMRWPNSKIVSLACVSLKTNLLKKLLMASDYVWSVNICTVGAVHVHFISDSVLLLCLQWPLRVKQGAAVATELRTQRTL